MEHAPDLIILTSDQFGSWLVNIIIGLLFLGAIIENS